MLLLNNYVIWIILLLFHVLRTATFSTIFTDISIIFSRLYTKFSEERLKQENLYVFSVHQVIPSWQGLIFLFSVITLSNASHICVRMTDFIPITKIWRRMHISNFWLNSRYHSTENYIAELSKLSGFSTEPLLNVCCNKTFLWMMTEFTST